MTGQAVGTETAAALLLRSTVLGDNDWQAGLNVDGHLGVDLARVHLEQGSVLAVHGHTGWSSVSGSGKVLAFSLLARFCPNSVKMVAGPLAPARKLALFTTASCGIDEEVCRNRQKSGSGSKPYQNCWRFQRRWM
jgi:hypothetical protein